MNYQVLFKPSALRKWQRLPRKIQVRIGERIEALAANPYPSGVKKLQGEANTYRIRIGDYRVVYDVHQERVIILVLRVGHRSEVYR